MGPVGEIRMVPDPDTFRVLPYAAARGAMTVDMITIDGTALGRLPAFLPQAADAAAADLGIDLQMVVEFEWTMTQKN